MDERFQFDGERLRIGETSFQLGSGFSWDAWKSAPTDSFLLFKPASLLMAFDRFFSARRDALSVRNIFEIGIWDGGSSAFWFEYFQPDKLVAVDRLSRVDSEYFKQYVEACGSADRLKTYWGVDQGDSERIGEIADAEFDGGLDLVLDDGSHLLEETRASFETLFPRLGPGGLYVIEDWNWEFNPQCREPDHPFAALDGLVDFVADLARLTGTSPVIRSITAEKGFAVVEKGIDGSLDIRALVAALPPGPQATAKSRDAS